MFTKFAKAQVMDVRSAPSRVRSASLNKFADFNEYRTDDGYVYVRVRAISSRVNKNHDGWPSEELQRAYRTFIGKPIFVDHHNSDPKKARGVIVDAALHVEDQHTSSLDPYYASEGVDPSHLPPTWIELLLEVDAKKFPRLAKAVVSGDIDGVSMGANVEYSVCSHCGNTAHTPEEFCKHVISKGAYFDYHTPQGLKISKKAYENCHKIGFFEISFVFDPADETALTSEVITERRAKIAAILKEGTDLYDQENDPENIAVMEEEPEATWGVAPGDEFAQVVENRFQQLIQMGYPEEQARELAEMEYRGPGKGVDLHEMRRMLDQGATHDQAYQILTKTKTSNKYIKKHGDKWVIIQKGTGKVLSTHDSEEKANASFRAMEMHKHEGSTKTADDRRNPLPQSDMTSAPDEVNTLRKEQECPICGSTMEDGVCEVCNYDEPPEGMDNPDLSKAKETDKQTEDQMAQQAAPQAPEGGAAGVEPTMPGAPAATGSPALASFFSLSPPVMGEKTSATNNSGRINTQERPILPATRQLSDKPIDQKVIQEAKKPVESKTKDTMTQTQKTADGVTPGDPSFKADKRVDVLGIGGVDSDTDAEKQVDVLGVGAVTGDPLSGIEHENVEKDTGDFTAPHTDTWSGGEGDSLGQQEPVTSETGDLFTVSSIVKQHGDKFVVVEKGTGKVLSSHDTHEAAQKVADSSADLGGPMGTGVGDGGSAKDGGPTWDTPGNGFPDHDPTRVDLNAGLKEEIGAGTMTDPNEEFRSLKHAEPITSDGANDLGGPIGTAIAKAKAIQLKAFKLAETEIELGITDHESKYDRVAELEGHSEDALDAQLATLSKVKTAGLRKSAAPTTQKTAGRMPSLRPVVAASGIDIEAHAVSDQEIEDSLW